MLLDERIRIGIESVRIKHQPAILLVELVYRIDKLELDDLLVRTKTREIEYVVIFGLCRRHKYCRRDIRIEVLGGLKVVITPVLRYGLLIYLKRK